MHDIINSSTFICPFESGKSGKEDEKIQKFEYLENKKSFFKNEEKRNSFLTAIWLSHGQLWAIIDRAASLS